jgi:hypothetical protein
VVCGKKGRKHVDMMLIFLEKCHDTYVTDYVPTQQRKCETSFQKNCKITYKPTVRRLVEQAIPFYFYI